VLPIGGVREKLLAAKRMGVFEVVLPRGNAADVDELPERLKEGLRIHYVRRFDELVPIVFAKR
ncbi:MAG: hypothetical protein D6771_03135, partial [Zetaproteobacteria bacterium]